VLAPGLVAQRVTMTATPIAGGPPCLDAVTADLARYRLRVLTARRDGAARPAPTWRALFQLAAVTNAGMFHEGGAPVGLIVEDGIAVGADNARFGGVLAFDPRAAGDPPAVITGRDCPGYDLEKLRTHYRSLIQSSRLLDCDGAPERWADAKHYSAAAIGIDRAGRVVMLHARAALTMSELASELAHSGLDLAGALFLEGGPEASLVAGGDHAEVARTGSYETGFIEDDSNHAFWELPNVIGLEPR